MDFSRTTRGIAIDIKPWLGKYRVPVEALRLAEDIQTLDLILKLLDGIDSKTIDDDYATARKLKIVLTGAKRLAEETLRFDYMAGKPISRGVKGTMRDVWKQIL